VLTSRLFTKVLSRSAKMLNPLQAKLKVEFEPTLLMKEACWVE